MRGPGRGTPVSRPAWSWSAAGLAGVSRRARAAPTPGPTVDLLERRGKLGGLTWSFQRKGRWFDNGQHVFLRCCTAYRGFLERIGADRQVHLQPRLDVPVLAPGRPPGRHRPYRRCRPRSIWLGSLARYRHLSLADRLRLGRARPGAAPTRPRRPGARRRRPSGAWLAEHGQSAQAIERLWNLIALPTINVPADEASLALAAMVFRTGLLDRADAGDIGWSQVPLGELHGEQRRPRRSRRRRRRGPLGRGCRAGHAAPTRARRSQLADGQVLEADAVIVATPPDGRPPACSRAACSPAVDGLGASPIVNVHLVLDRRVTDLPMAAGDRVAGAVRLRPHGLGAAWRKGSAWPSPCRGPTPTSASDPRTWSRILPRRPRRAAPGGRRRPARRRHGQPRARGHLPGRARARPRCGPLADRPRSTGLLVAGAWCDTGWPATMEGAVRSGQRAAAPLAAARQRSATARPPARGGGRVTASQ